MPPVNTNSENDPPKPKKPNKGQANIRPGANQVVLKELGEARRAAEAAREAQRIAEAKIAFLTERAPWPRTGSRLEQMQYIFNNPPAEGKMTQPEVVLRDIQKAAPKAFVEEMDRLARGESEPVRMQTCEDKSVSPAEDKPEPDESGAKVCELIDKILAEANES